MCALIDVTRNNATVAHHKTSNTFGLGNREADPLPLLQQVLAGTDQAFARNHA